MSKKVKKLVQQEATKVVQQKMHGQHQQGSYPNSHSQQYGGHHPQGANTNYPPTNWNPQMTQPGQPYPPTQPYPHQGMMGGAQPYAGYPPHHQMPLSAQTPPTQSSGMYPTGNFPPYGAPQQAYGYSVTQTSYSASGNPCQAGGQMYPGNKVELSVSCSSLTNKDTFSKSDPVCIVFEKRSGKWAELDRTEMLHNNLNPEWQKKFILDYNPQVPQDIKFEIYDWDTKAEKTKRQDFLGSVEVSLQKVMEENYSNRTCQLLLKNGGRGRINIMAEEIKSYANTKIKLQFTAHHLDKKDFLGKSDPYYILRKKMPNGEWSLVYKSEFVEKNCNPKWKAMDKTISEICSGDYERELKIEIYDHDERGKDDLIGELITNLSCLTGGASNGVELEIINREMKAKKKKYQNSGTISVSQLQFQ
jgi:hypothetical protein